MSRFINSWDIQRHPDGMTVIIFSHLLADSDEQMEPIVLTEIDALALGNELSELQAEEESPSQPTAATNSVTNSSDANPPVTSEAELSLQPPSPSVSSATPANPADTAGPTPTSLSQPTKEVTNQ